MAKETLSPVEELIRAHKAKVKTLRSRKVTVTCYGKTKSWPSAQKAYNFFSQGMESCDPGSSEYSRYAYIVEQLNRGETEVTDEYWA